MKQNFNNASTGCSQDPNNQAGVSRRPHHDETPVSGNKHMEQGTQIQDELLTVSQVACLLKVPVSWVYERTRRNGTEQIPHVKLGKYLRFRRAAIDTWLDRFLRN
jgi:excisionase family DNA binding protein